MKKSKGKIEIIDEKGTKQEFEYRFFDSEQTKKSYSPKNAFVWTMIGILILGILIICAFIILKKYGIDKTDFMGIVQIIIGSIQIGIAIITLVFAIKIPIRIMSFQRYTNLMTFYASFDFAHSYQSVINFFYDDCGRDVEKIAQNYKERFLNDFEKYKNKEIELCDILHYQRRLLNDYFFELEMCRQSDLEVEKIIQRDWTASEAWVIKIIMYMNNAIDDDSVMEKDISCIKDAANPEIKRMNKTLLKLYEVLKVKSSN